MRKEPRTMGTEGFTGGQGNGVLWVWHPRKWTTGHMNFRWKEQWIGWGSLESS